MAEQASIADRRRCRVGTGDGVGHELTLKFPRGNEVIEKSYRIEERPGWEVTCKDKVAYGKART